MIRSNARPDGPRPGNPAQPAQRGCRGSDDRVRSAGRYFVLSDFVLSVILLVSWTAFLLLVALRG